jgi:chitin synthase
LEFVVSDDGVLDYEAEAWETGTHRSEETGYSSKPHSRQPPRSHEESPPHTYQQASQSGDYYRDTNLTFNNSSNPNLRLGGSQLSHSNMSQHQLAPQLPFMPFSGGPGSAAGSDFGGGIGMPMAQMNTGSMYGMMPPGHMGMAMNPMAPNMSMLGVGSFGGSQGGGFGGVPPSLPPLGTQQRPMSTFSLATTANPFLGPSNSTNPTDEELTNALRNYLSTQDLMTVTKK